MEDYSELEGKVVPFIAHSGKKYKARIAGCDYDIGITMVNEEDHDDYLFCMYGPTVDKMTSQKLYKGAFEEIIKMIREGCFNEGGFYLIVRAHSTGEASRDTCPFNQ